MIKLIALYFFLISNSFANYVIDESNVFDFITNKKVSKFLGHFESNYGQKIVIISSANPEFIVRQTLKSTTVPTALIILSKEKRQISMVVSDDLSTIITDEDRANLIKQVTPLLKNKLYSNALVSLVNNTSILLGNDSSTINNSPSKMKTKEKYYHYVIILLIFIFIGRARKMTINSRPLIGKITYNDINIISKKWK